eukprot:TRINITY_DN35518_c0_g1_i1.p1 TRINITY_DN35518_c0_g1~~TRINITY_DN35518_c0_g1_i1.p1  ORF type:complete len:139 (-),score=28.48 TRINITY_DN35518_c0_g1_i1:722-1138(-)
MAQNELVVSVIGARDLFNTENFTRQDPYVVVSYAGHVVHQTPVAEDQGTNPSWNDKFTLKMLPGNYDLRFILKNDNNITKDAEIGATQVHFEKALTTGIEDFEADIFHNDKPKGKLRMIFDYPFVRNRPPPPAMYYGR